MRDFRSTLIMKSYSTKNNIYIYIYLQLKVTLRINYSSTKWNQSTFTMAENPQNGGINEVCSGNSNHLTSSAGDSHFMWHSVKQVWWGMGRNSIWQTSNSDFPRHIHIIKKSSELPLPLMQIYFMKKSASCRSEIFICLWHLRRKNQLNLDLKTHLLSPWEKQELQSPSGRSITAKTVNIHTVVKNITGITG